MTETFETDEANAGADGNTRLDKFELCRIIRLGKERPKDTPGLLRNLFRVRDFDIPSILGHKNAKITRIHQASGATIDFCSHPRHWFHSYLELTGMDDEVQIAQALIVDAITKEYGKQFVPTALMPPSYSCCAFFTPIRKVSDLWFYRSTNRMRMEAETGAWIEFGTCKPPFEAEERMLEIIIHGSVPQVFYAVKKIDSSFYQKPVKLKQEHVRDTPVEELTSTEETVHQESAKLEDANKQHPSDKETAHDDSDHIDKEKQPPLKKLRVDHLGSSDETHVGDAETEIMECDEETDKNALMPRSLERNSNRDDDGFYIPKIVGQYRLQGTAGPYSEVSRKVFLVRDKDIPKDESINYIRRASGAKVVLSPEPDFMLSGLALSHLELSGADEEVQMAELLFVDAIIEKYEKLLVPTALMPNSHYRHKLSIPSVKVTPLLDSTSNQLVKWEAETGAWIQISSFEVEHPVREVMMRKVFISDANPRAKPIHLDNKPNRLENLQGKA